MHTVGIIFPHQLFKNNPLLKLCQQFYLVEEGLFFKQYNFHQQKIAFHRASMQFYFQFLKDEKVAVNYVDSQNKKADVRKLIADLPTKKIKTIWCVDPVDDWLTKRLTQSCEQHNIELKLIESPLFLNASTDLTTFFRADKKKFFHTKFYIEQRKKRYILIDAGEKPIGGKWSFDAENRKKYPAKKQPPTVQLPAENTYYEEAKQYVNKNFNDNIGELSKQPLYATTFIDSEKWLQQFLQKRFEEFGIYEDAIVEKEIILNHSVLTPMLNVGLLTPQQILDAVVDFAEKKKTPINSTEGFVRQIIGWREFIRGVYICKGAKQRTTNFWKFDRKIPASFYDGTTGILPIDSTIKKVLKTGYCHHIERLMVLGNFMVLCEIDPSEVYRWFMELFIDAYDWVMVPNVYGMSQFADGGLMSTKPYISGSNYLKKMSNYGKGDWQAIWDALFWRFMNVHRDFFSKNPRLGMLIRNYDKMAAEKRNLLMDTAEKYLNNIGK